MKNYLLHKQRYINDFANSMTAVYKQMRYGISTCSYPKDSDLACMRKHLIDWQSNADGEALSANTINLTTYLPVTYESDAEATYHRRHASHGAGYYTSPYANGPKTVGIGYNYGNGNTNVVEVNTDGFITRINLNPAITIQQNPNVTVNTNSSFEFTQQTPSTEWIITHNMNMIPNVTTADLLGNAIEGIVQVIDSNIIHIFFNTPSSGRAYLS